MYARARSDNRIQAPNPATENALAVLVFVLFAVLVPVSIVRLIGEVHVAAAGLVPWAPFFWATSTFVRLVGLAILALAAVGCAGATLGSALALARGSRGAPHGRLAEIYALAAALAIGGLLYLR